jgi:hypothetical protein
MLAGCESGPHRVVVSSGGDYDDTDFYYTGGAPYSRTYGVLVLRDGGYYYNRGGNYYRYERHHHGGAYAGGYHGDREVRRVDNVRNVENVRTVNNVNYRNETVRNDRAVRNDRVVADHRRAGAQTTQVNAQRTAPPGARAQVRTPAGTRTVTAAPGQPTVVHKKKVEKPEHD